MDQTEQDMKKVELADPLPDKLSRCKTSPALLMRYNSKKTKNAKKVKFNSKKVKKRKFADPLPDKLMRCKTTPALLRRCNSTKAKSADPLPAKLRRRRNGARVLWSILAQEVRPPKRSETVEDNISESPVPIELSPVCCPR